jgi:hypothetical protein
MGRASPPRKTDHEPRWDSRPRLSRPSKARQIWAFIKTISNNSSYTSSRCARPDSRGRLSPRSLWRFPVVGHSESLQELSFRSAAVSPDGGRASRPSCIGHCLTGGRPSSIINLCLLLRRLRFFRRRLPRAAVLPERWRKYFRVPPLLQILPDESSWRAARVRRTGSACVS